VSAEGKKIDSVEDAIKASYENDKTPDGTPMTDEYIPCCVVGDYEGVKDGDCVMHTNYRQDRAIQLTQAFVCDDYAGVRSRRPNVTFLGFSRYWDEFEDYLLGSGGAGSSMDNLLGEVISKAGLKQLRIAETQKFRHVTSFFNGKSTTPSEGEDQVDVPSRFDPATFASHPEMDAYTVTDELLKRLENNPYSFIAVNYANCDMVGHTGDFDAARKAVEVTDECIGKLLPRLMELDAHVLIFADHGNAEELLDEDGHPKTAHTTNQVPCIIYDNTGNRNKYQLARIVHPGLANLAATIATMLGTEPAPSWQQSLITVI
jgi:2,3-bisphosphoglycerate-independent phosphoglycerate mutase